MTRKTKKVDGAYAEITGLEKPVPPTVQITYMPFFYPRSYPKFQLTPFPSSGSG